MADEPRRSGRATKGQHTKDKESTTDETPKQKGRGRGKKAKADPEPEEEEEEGGDEIIRCVCGLYEEEEDNPRSMICCDNCSAWQHNECMGLPEDYAPDTYFCEQCRPQDHKELLKAIEKGEKPWEEAIRRREEAEAEKSTKKKGKRGRKPGPRTSDAPRTPTLEPEEASSKKRKLEESPAQDLKAKKVRGSAAAEDEEPNGEQSRKTSQTPARQPSQTSVPLEDVAGDAKELSNPTRRNAANGLSKMFVEQTKEAVKNKQFSLPSGTSAQNLGTQIGLQVEHAVNQVQCAGMDEPDEKYKTQLRTILHNVKNNPALALKLMVGTLTPVALASMSSQDMASDEQKQKDAAMKKELEKQHTIIEDQGPRIRRTHKGEEYVDERIAAESATSNASVRKANAADQDAEMKSPDAATSSEKILRKPSAAAKGRPFGDPRRKSSTNFDIDRVWSGVQGSPTEENAPRFPEVTQSGSPTAPPNNAAADPEIDNLLKDEDAESEPYSPKDFSEEGIVWRGRINGGNLGQFTGTAKFAAGAQPSADTLRMTWTDIIPAEIKLHGRIAPSKADDYLCGLEYSNTTELVIVSIAEPKSSHETQQFEKFFGYLKQKERYGVGMQHQVAAIKDIYLIPLDVGQPLPSVMKALEHSFPDPVQERQFLVPIVIKWTELPQNADRVRQEGMVMSPSVGPPVAQTPITPHESQQPQFPQANQTQAANTMNGASQRPQNANANQQFSTPPPPYASQPQQTTPAASNALRILGPELAAAPAVRELVQQAPTAGENEFNIIKECIMENSEAAQSLVVLTQMLQAKYGSRQAAEQTRQQAPVQAPS